MQTEPNVSHGLYTCVGGEGVNLVAGNRRPCVIIEVDLAADPVVANIQLLGYSKDGFPGGMPIHEMMNVPMGELDKQGTWCQVTA